MYINQIAIYKPHDNHKTNHIKKRKESKHNARDSHQITKEENKRKLQNRITNDSKMINKMAINTHLSVITLM